MKKILLIAVMLCSLFASVCAAEADKYKLQNSDFTEGLRFWIGANRLKLSPEALGFVIEKQDGKNVLVARGREKKKDFQLVQHINLKTEQILNKKVTFGAMVNPEKLTGTFRVMIREVGKKGTIRYRIISMNKYTPAGWKKYISEFVVSAPTVCIQFYIKSEYLGAGDQVFLKEPFITIEPRKKAGTI
ncbi:MAG: hypothetical protein J6S53_10170 [Lentisphaeria bacterium]|nr:hypothetical protein [Lentisphaeria bacterium]